MSLERPCAGSHVVVCVRRDCDRCGWNPAVEAERIAQIRAGVMRMNVYGLDYYPVPRAGDGKGIDEENAD